MMIRIHLLSSGDYYHATGDGPCDWAQWPRGQDLRDDHFFPGASEQFRAALRATACDRCGGPLVANLCDACRVAWLEQAKVPQPTDE